MTSQADIEEVFQALATPTPRSLSARALPDCPGFRVARQVDGAAVLLLSLPNPAVTPPATGAQLANLTYLPRGRVRIETDSGTNEESIHSVLACAGADADMRRYFFRVSAALVNELGPSPATVRVDAAVGRLLELFRALEQPSRRSLQGVWAELLLIAHSSDPAAVLAAWHSEPAALHDFVAGGHRVEVKSTTRPVRQHHFSLQQLTETRGAELLVLSLMVQPRDPGTSISQLVERISPTLPANTEHRSRLEAVVAASIGSDWRLMTETGFDEEAAVASLRHYLSAQIPAVNLDLPVQVSDVRFVVDLSTVPATSPDIVTAHGGLFAAINP